MQNNISIDSNGIKKALKNKNIYSSLFEYIWNGFDAEATKIEIELNFTELGRIDKIKVIDNGTGINFKELKNKFEIFYHSSKALYKNLETTHGRNGIGRFSFFNFATSAKWTTIYKTEEFNYKKYEIKMNEKTLDSYETSNELSIEEVESMTEVEFILKEETIFTQEKLMEELKKNFNYYLELKKNLNVEILVNGIKLEYSDTIIKIIEDEKVIDGFKFAFKFCIWKDRQVETSKYYFLGDNTEKVLSENTKFNRKGDQFKHSIFIKSQYFDEFIYKEKVDIQDGQTLYISKTNSDKIFQNLIEDLNKFLNTERKKFLKIQAKPAIEKLKSNNAFPKYGQNPWDKIKEEELEGFVEELYIVEPKIFTNLSKIQQQTLIRLLGLVMDSDERDSLFEVLEPIVSLSSEEREELKEILSRNSIQSLTNTIKLIEDRYKAIEYLKELVYNKNLNTYEVPHIQEFIENHFWIFGEEFSLITSAEPKFKEAVQKYWLEVTGEEKNIDVIHEDAKKEMDIFLCCKDMKDGKIRNIVVELKRPSVKLSRKEYRQLEDYKSVIRKTPEFNALNEEWVFILTGKELATDGFIEDKYKSASNHGEKFLTEKVENYKVYVKKWSELISEFEVRHNFLNEKLKIQRDKLIAEIKNPTLIVEECVKNNSAKVG
ncbi:MAG: ATP-binding protein [Cetobacterium sp.]